jgi:hypothetical protein
VRGEIFHSRQKIAGPAQVLVFSRHGTREATAARICKPYELPVRRDRRRPQQNSLITALSLVNMLSGRYRSFAGGPIVRGVEIATASLIATDSYMRKTKINSRWMAAKCERRLNKEGESLPAIQATGLELLPRWDFHPLFMPAFAGRTLPITIREVSFQLLPCYRQSGVRSTSYLIACEPLSRISTSLLALCCQSGLDATLATPTRARSRSIGSRSFRISPLLTARFTSLRIASCI